VWIWKSHSSISYYDTSSSLRDYYGAMKFLLKLRAASDEIGIVCCCAGGLSPERIEINSEKTEPRVEVLKPFIVTDKRSVEVSPDIDALAYGPFKAIDMPLHEFYLFLGIPGRDAVLGYDERDLEPSSRHAESLRAERPMSQLPTGTLRETCSFPPFPLSSV